MTIDEIASFCEYKDCQVSAGDPKAGFIHFTGRGLDLDRYTYGRFNMLGEVKSPPSPEAVLAEASTFLVRRPNRTVKMDRDEFETELRRYLTLVGE